MLRKTRHIVNNKHVMYAIRNNALPRMYKDIGKKDKDSKKNISFSPYIIKK